MSILAAGYAQAAELTLPEAIRLAWEKNPELRATSGKTEAAAGQAEQAGRWSNPELQLSVEDWPLRGAGWSSSKRLAGVSQTLPFPGKKKLEREIGATGVKLSQAELALRRVETVRDVKAAFYQVLAAEGLVKEGGDLVKTAENLAAAVDKRVDAGAAPEPEKLRMAIPLEKARMDLADFQRNLVVARKTLATLLGRADLGGLTVTGTLAESGDLACLGKLPEGHPSRLAAQVNVTRAELALRRARLEIYPDVTVGMGAGREAITNNSIGEIRFGVPLPLFDTSIGKRREARANLAVAEAESASVDLRLSNEWSLTAGRVRLSSEQARVYRERVLPQANEAFHRVQTGYDEGKFPLVDVLETRRTAAEARLAYQQKLLELNIAQAELEALAGQLK
ncbi:MAG: TolC family protein [Verrucomicrobiota bacterium]